MAAFEISVNGRPRFADDDVRVITFVADPVPEGQKERVYVHVGLSDTGQYQVQLLGGDLHPGDEITIRVLAEDDVQGTNRFPEFCSFCGSDIYDIVSIVQGPDVAICGSCVAAFRAVITNDGALPLGASILDRGPGWCGFCHKSPPEVVGLIVRNSVGICPECLHACTDLSETPQNR